MGSDGSEVIQEHARAMEQLRPDRQHNTLIEAFPDASIRQLFLAAGCVSFTERGATVPSEIYSL